MTPEQAEQLRYLVEISRAQGETINAMRQAIEEIGKRLMKGIAGDAVLTAATGALYAELARVSGKQGALDEMLARFTAVLEANPDSRGHVLEFTDQIRSAAEAMGGSPGAS